MANKKVSQLTSKPSVLVTDLFPIADPSTGQLYKTTISDLGTAIGSGVSSVNGLVGAVVLDTDDIQELVSPTNKWFTDTRARAALSASSPLAYNSGTGVFSIPAATSSQNGYLTSTDWTTFNSKQAALSGTGFVKISGTTISYDNSTYALDSAVVKLTGDQTVAGVKTFSSNVIGNQFTVGTPFDTSRSFAAAGNQHTIALWLEEYTSTGGGAPDLFFNNGRGTISSKANIQVGDGLGGITWAGYVNGNFNGSVGLGASVVNIDSTNNQANADFSISQSYNSVSQTENLRVYANGGGLYIRGNVQGASFVKAGGTSSQFLKADGSIDSSTYLTTGTASSTYLPLSGGTLTGALEVNSDIIITNGSFYKAKRSTGSAAIGVLGFDSGSDSLTVKGGTSGGNVSIKFQDTGGTIAAFYNGNFGINTISAAYKLDVNGTGNFAGTLRVSHSTSGGYGGIIYNTSSGGEGLTIRGGSTSSHNSLIVQNYNGSTSLLSVLANGVTTHTAVDDSGNRTNPFNSLIITTDNPSLPYGGFGGSILFNNRSYTHGIVTTSRIRSVIYDDGANQGGGFIFETTTTAGGTLTPAITIDYNRNILINKTSTTFDSTGVRFISNGQSTHTVASDAIIFLNRTGSDGVIQYFYKDSGSVGSISVTSSATSYNTSSDYRLKEDLKPINGLEIVNKIKVYDYEWKSDKTRMDGVLAHELAEVLPYAVTGVKDGEQMQSVDYSKIVPVMVQAIKDLKSKIETLENK